MRRPAVFLDKDGTLIEDVPYNVDPGQVRLLPGTAEGLRRLHDVGLPLVVVSNQSGVARGYFPESALAVVEGRLRALLQAEGVPLAGFYYCPHHPGGSVPAYAVECECRKPRPGLVRKAAAELGLDPGRSWVVGDSAADVTAGQAVGCRTVLIRKVSANLLPSPLRPPHHVAADLAAAAALVLRGLDLAAAG
jgi:D-glycero-D-manno-heptose 1,7-bisphosphate phosphatase